MLKTYPLRVRRLTRTSSSRNGPNSDSCPVNFNPPPNLIFHHSKLPVPLFPLFKNLLHLTRSTPLLPLDLGFHLVPSVVLTLDFLLFSPPWTITFPRAVLLSGFLSFTYWFWVEQCHRHNGWYPYPLFEPLTTGWRIVVFSTSALLMAGSTMALKAVHGIVNVSDESDEPKVRSE